MNELKRYNLRAWQLNSIRCQAELAKPVEAEKLERVACRLFLGGTLPEWYELISTSLEKHTMTRTTAFELAKLIQATRQSYASYAKACRVAGFLPESEEDFNRVAKCVGNRTINVGRLLKEFPK